MKLFAQFLFHQLEETKRMFAPSGQSLICSDAARGTGFTYFLLTKEYDAIKELFADLGFDVPEQDDGWQIIPVFNRGRACFITRAGDGICLEECTDSAPSGPLYLHIGDIGVARLLRLKPKYSVREMSDSGYLQIALPGGGTIIFTANT